jgi:vitamin B12 transporter
MDVCKVVRFLVVLIVFPVFSQEKIKDNGYLESIQNLKTVAIKASKFHKTDRLGQKTIEVSAKEIARNPTNFTELLRYNSPIVFKDYGNGGTSSARFRGTSASNTVVLWNGININAVGSGQTDFNSLCANTADEIIIKSGGGSVEYGSGAIGGTVHLKDHLIFDIHQEYQLFSSYGSFNTSSNFFKANLGTGKWAVKLSGVFNSSDNNYPYIDDRYQDEDGNSLKNENGNYINYGVDLGIGYKISDKNKIYFYTTGYYGNRLFSDGLPNPAAGSERNEDFNQRNLLKWFYRFGDFTQIINTSFISQEYRYYDNKDNAYYSFGKSQTASINYSLNYRFSNAWSLKYLMVGDHIDGQTTDLISENRGVFSLGGILNYKPNSDLIFSLGARKEYNSDFQVPISASLSAEQKVAKYFWLKVNVSANYRVPTFNEIYWPVAGNRDLIPENSRQGEFGLEFENFGLKFNSTLFYIDLKDKIIWKPLGNSNLWTPVNLDAAVNKGAELFLGYTKKNGNHFFHLSGNYTYTEANDGTNRKQLPYAPKHLLNYNLEYGYGIAKLYFQDLYQSNVFTNRLALDFYALDPVHVMNLGLDISLFDKENTNLVLGGKINNIGNRLYYFTNLRPMPGRNYTININYKF